MKQLTIYPITVLFTLLLAASPIFGQFNVNITVNSGNATTTCTDPFGSPDPVWAVNIAGQGWVTYPGNAFCPVDLPNLQFQQSFQCVADVPPAIQVCLRAFENDAPFFDPCNEVLTCQVESCFDIPVPFTGSTDYTLELADTLASDGEANITIAVDGFPGGLFDEVCNALDLGVMVKGDQFGDADTSIFNNYCATGVNEPAPIDFGAVWSTEQSIWFKFTTSDDPSTIIRFLANSDPSNFGDPINLQMGIFTTDDGTCAGNFDLVVENFTYTIYDEWIYFECPQPNTTYFVLIDAVSGSFFEIEGYFGFEITEMGLVDAPNEICNAIAFGQVPEGDTVGLAGPMTNVCADGIGDPPNGSWSIENGVWFSFAAPSSGHVLIEAISDVDDVPIDLQVALYSSSDGTCNGMVAPLENGYDDSSFDEALEVSCLNPGQTYFLLIDGAQGDNNAGIFTLNISDAGDDTPVTMLDETVCFGETFPVGSSIYTQSGSYADTLILPTGCDSIVLLDLTVLTDIDLNFSIVQQGVGVGNDIGQAQVAPTGGNGDFTFLWDDGQTTPLATNLVGGDTYCIEIADGIGCTADTCFEMPYYVNFVPDVQGSTVDCFGDQDGTLNFTASFGVPPYLYSWQNSLNTISGSGTITADGQMISVANLPAGVYSVFMQDIVFDTTVIVEILEPDLLEVGSFDLANASCYGNCDGNILLDVTGGTPPYQINWSNGIAGPQVSSLCKGFYSVEITDANGCTASFDYEITEPDEFLATAVQVQAVSCFEGNDGIASVTTNGSPTGFQWSNNNESTETIDGLAGGTYEVTVTNLDGCTASSSIEISTPAEPVGVALEILEPVICNGGEDGAMTANATGPGLNFSYAWSNGSNTQTASGLDARTYSVTISNELGCEATASLTLDEPSAIMVDISSNTLTCNDPPDGGIVTIEQINGGVPPYSFSSNGFDFSDALEVTGFQAGQQSLFIQDAGGCIIQVPATIEGPTELVVFLGEDQTIELGDELTLTAQVNALDVTYQWFPEQDSTCGDCSSIDISPMESGLYSVIVTDGFDCTETADVYINVIKKRKVFVPNAFSPNGDGINDEFMPYAGKDVLKIREFRVFDRQGNMVFAASDFFPGDLESSWDGIFRGQMMQPGVFA